MKQHSRGATSVARIRPNPPRRRRRTRIALLTSAALGAALVPMIAMANLTGSTFESTDGNLVVTNAGNFDWENAPNRESGVELASGKGDNSLGQGAKEDLVNTTVVNGSIPPNKSDLTRFYIANEKANGDEFMYLAWERTNTLGSANMDFEINKLAQPDLTTPGAKTLNRSLGDLLVRFDFSNGGSTPTLTLVKWITAPTGSVSDCYKNQTLPCWGALPDDDELDGVDDEQIDLSHAGFADGSINAVTVAEPVAGGNLAAATFGEAAINMTDAGVFEAGECTSFGSAYLKSRSSDAFDAELKDFVAPQAIDINNCGGLTIRKVTVGGQGTFDYTSNSLDPDTFSLTTTAAGDAGADDTGTAYQGILAGTYDVTETAQDGWTLTDISCKNADDSNHAATTDLDAGT
ncbi:MAG: prealbumin-like fold domain-containing protein, partial [Nocardioides sp.]